MIQLQVIVRKPVVKCFSFLNLIFDWNDKKALLLEKPRLNIHKVKIIHLVLV